MEGGAAAPSEGVPPEPVSPSAWKPGSSSFSAKKKKDGKKGKLELEEGAKFGGKFGKWKELHFVIRGDKLLVFENVLENEDQKRFEFLCADVAMRLPKTQRKGRPFVFRIDTTTKEKLMVDPGSAEEREAWIIEMGNAGANVPGEYADKIDQEMAEALVTRGNKKNWMNMKTPLGWKPFWFEYAMPNITYHERPGADAKGTVDISKLELEAGPTVEAELGRDFSWKTNVRDGDDPISLPWTGLAADSKQECASWLKTLSTRKVTLNLTQAEEFGLQLSDTCVVTGYQSEPDGEPGPAEVAQVRIEQVVVEVDGADVKSKMELLNLFRPAGNAVQTVILTIDGIGLPPIKEDEDEDDYLARLAAEDEERMRKEMEDEEAMAAKMEAELAARLAEEAAEKERLRIEEEERKKREAEELQAHMSLIMELTSHLKGDDAQSTAQMLSGNMDRTHTPTIPPQLDFRGHFLRGCLRLQGGCGSKACSRRKTTRRRRRRCWAVLGAATTTSSAICCCLCNGRRRAASSDGASDFHRNKMAISSTFLSSFYRHCFAGVLGDELSGFCV